MRQVSPSFPPYDEDTEAQRGRPASKWDPGDLVPKSVLFTMIHATSEKR